MFKLFGEKPRCTWCGRSDCSDYREISIPTKRGAASEQMLICSEACETHLRESQVWIEEKIPLFLAGLVLSVLSVLVGVFVKSLTLYLLWGGVALLGLTVVLFPFVTPQTIQIFGFAKGLWVGRITGMVILVGALVSAYMGWGR